MSYDIWLVMGPEETEVADCGNMTSNVAPMWRAAGADLAQFEGRLAGDCIPLLMNAIKDMIERPASYKGLEPRNGWGSYDGCLRYLQKILRDCQAMPLATVLVAR